VGYRWTPYVRTSVEGFFEQYKSKRWENISTGSASGLESQVNGGVMANLYLDMPNSSRFTPYVGGGIGMLHLRTPVVWVANNLRLIDWTTAYQLMAGTSYHLAGPLHGAGSAEMYAGYRFVKSMEDATNNCRCGGATAEYDYQSHSADLGIRYNF
jgi:opacity protein-like surface antigen